MPFVGGNVEIPVDKVTKLSYWHTGWSGKSLAMRNRNASKAQMTCNGVRGLYFASAATMITLQTKYGLLKGVLHSSAGPTGDVESVMLTEPNMLHLPMATWVPLYKVEDHGRRKETPILFYPDGSLKSMPLQASSMVNLTCGTVAAELVTFYPSGEIRRVFPTAGKLSGYWTEDHEYEYSPVCEICVLGETIRAKIINLHFYQSGALQSITLWPKERIALPFVGGPLGIRSGVSFYANGALKSYEPAEPVLVDTPIGKIMAYDNQPLGVTADVNSLQFSPEGVVTAVTTVSSRVRIFPSEGMPAELAPYKVQSFCEEADTELRALHIRFQDGVVQFQGAITEEFPLKGSEFETIHISSRVSASCCQSG